MANSKKKKSQHLASISLAVMAIGFLATIPLQDYFWGALLQGGFEAGLVGGLADWFAVTALFRHPMGIPIPHTALLPKNRNRITATIISMLENDWLTKESIRGKISSIPITEKLIELAEKEIDSQPVKTNTIKVIQHLINSIKVESLAAVIEKEVKMRLGSVELKNYLPSLIDELSKRKYDEKALDYILNEINDWAGKDSTRDKLGRMAVERIENIKADGFMQFALRSFSNLVNEEKLGSIIQNLIQKGVESYRDPYNLNRQTLLFHVHSKLQNLKTDDKLYSELNTFKEQLLSKLDLEEKIALLLNELKEKAITFTSETDFYENYILPLLKNGFASFKADEGKVAAIEAWIKKQISDFVDKNHSRIGKLVEENLEKLDTETLILMLETNIGKDLQWIRVNGAVCGFFIGLILVGIRMFF
jgi:uncharacterized membrane-anchored protein YjiN (DUF445 family)